MLQGVSSASAYGGGRIHAHSFVQYSIGNFLDVHAGFDVLAI